LRRGWPAYALQRIRILATEWRSIAEKVAEACRRLLGDKCLAVYVVGGVAEDRITALSDLDIAIVVSDHRYKNLEMILAIKREAEKLGIPSEVTLDVKLLTQEELKKLLQRGIYKRCVKIL